MNKQIHWIMLSGSCLLMAVILGIVHSWVGVICFGVTSIALLITASEVKK